MLSVIDAILVFACFVVYFYSLANESFNFELPVQVMLGIMMLIQLPNLVLLTTKVLHIISEKFEKPENELFGLSTAEGD